MNEAAPARFVGQLVYPLDWDRWRIVGGPLRVVDVRTRLSGTWVELGDGRAWLADQVEVVEDRGG